MTGFSSKPNLITPIISVGLIKEYYYCPLSAWLQYHYNIDYPVTPSMESGSELDYEKIADENNIPYPRQYNYCITNRRIGLRGCIDIVAGEKKKVIIEVKKYDRPVDRSSHFLVQALLYAYLYNITYGNVAKYGIIMGSLSFSWDYTLYDQRKAEKIVMNARKKLVRNTPPSSSGDPRKCSYCLIRRYCPYYSDGRKSIVL